MFNKLAIWANWLFNKKLKQNSAGLTLVEVLISSVFLTITALSIIGVFTSGYVVLQKAVAYHRGTEQGRAKLEELQNLPIEDVYPGDNLGQDSVDRDGCVDNKLTINYNWGVPNSGGSDFVIFCPIDGYPNGPNSTGDPSDKCKNSPPVYCTNRDANYDGSIDSADDFHNTLNGGQGPRLPAPGQFGFYTRTVRVSACSLLNTGGGNASCTVYDFNTTGDKKGREAPIKWLSVEIEWVAFGEKQTTFLNTMITRFIPKSAFGESGW